MPYVIDKVTGKRRWASSDLLGQLLDTGTATLEEGQTLFMDNGSGEVIKIQSEEYEDIAKAVAVPSQTKKGETFLIIYAPTRFMTSRQRGWHRLGYRGCRA
jgi:hypothetical protein